MDKEGILQKSQQHKDRVGEMERQAISKSSFIALLVTGILAVALMIVEGVFGHFSSIYAIATICFCWASIFYALQYFIGKCPKGVLIGAVLEGLAGIFFFVRFVLCLAGVW